MLPTDYKWKNNRTLYVSRIDEAILKIPKIYIRMKHKYIIKTIIIEMTYDDQFYN